MGLRIHHKCFRIPAEFRVTAVTIYAVARKCEILREIVQNLAQSCHGFAASVAKFCKRLELGAALDRMSGRLKAGMVAG
jgi:DNA polymerase theta